MNANVSLAMFVFGLLMLLVSIFIDRRSGRNLKEAQELVRRSEELSRIAQQRVVETRSHIEEIRSRNRELRRL